MHCARLSLNANPFIGMYARASDGLVILGGNATPYFEKACAVLGAKIIRARISGSGLVGIFCCMNSNGMVVPHTIARSELALLERAGLSIYVSRDRHNAFGNNIAANDNGAVANPEIDGEEVKRISEVLGVPVEQRKLAGYGTVGSVCVATNRGFICHNDSSEEERAFLESVFKVKGGNGTANMGSSFVGASLVANSRGYLAGERTSGFEMSKIDEELGFI